MAGVLCTSLLASVAACTRPAGQVDTAAGRGGQVGSVDATDDESLTDVQAALARGDFGTLKGVCGPAPAGEELTATGSQGVTADSITVGTFSDADNSARPGVNQELFDVGRVFTSWCNELGGIHGRKIILNEHDAQLFSYQPRMLEACQTDFFLVGGGAVFDGTGQKDRLNCLLPDIPGFLASPEARGAELMATPPQITDGAMAFGLGRYVTDRFPDTIDKVGYLTGNLKTLVDLGDQYEEAAGTLGWKAVYDDQYNAIGESTWLPYAQKIADAGVRGLLYLGEPENLGLLVQSLAQIGYQLDWLATTPNMYDPKLINTAGDTLSEVPVFMETTAVPFEYADRNPAMAAYQALFEKYLPDGRSRAMLGLSSLSAWLRFALAAGDCGADLTRRCVYDNGIAFTEWDSGGILPTLNAAGEEGSEGICFVPLQATPDGFEVLPWHENNDFYNCEAANLVQLSGEYTPGPTLADVGKTLDDLR